MSKSTLSEIVDLFLLRVTPPEGETERPYYTTGSIVAAALFRLTLIFISGNAFQRSVPWYGMVVDGSYTGCLGPWGVSCLAPVPAV